MLYFIGKLYKYVSGKLKHKLQAGVPVLCWYFLNLNEKTVVRKDFFSFLIAEICMILVFISSFSRGYVLRSGSNMFEQEKLFKISGVILAAEPSIKSFTFIFLGFCLCFNPAFKIKKFRTPDNGCFYCYEIRK